MLLHITKRAIKSPHLRSWNLLRCNIFSSFCLKMTKLLFSLYLFVDSAHRHFKYLLSSKPLLTTSLRVSDTCPLPHTGLRLKISFIIYWETLNIIAGANFSTAVGTNAEKGVPGLSLVFFNHWNLFTDQCALRSSCNQKMSYWSAFLKLSLHFIFLCLCVNSC